MGGVFQRQKSKDTSQDTRNRRRPSQPLFDFSSYEFLNSGTMSVLGIDLGNQSSYVATARAGGIELVLNDYSQRDTACYVSFGDRSRSMGTSARNNLAGNIQNTVFNFKRLLGRQFSDPMVQEEMKYVPYTIQEMSDGGVGIKSLGDRRVTGWAGRSVQKVNYLGNERVFTPEQVTAMHLGKLRAISEADLRAGVSDCVISVPGYFTDVERRSLLAAAQIAGLNVLRLMNESTAVALGYGLYSQELPESDQPAKNVIFVDIGYTSSQLAAVAYNKGKLKILGTVIDPNLGGRNFDYAMIGYFADHFKKLYKIDVFSNKRAMMRLRDECEKLKKMMSSIGNEIPLNIECFMNDKDVSGKMKREDYEGLIAGELQRLESRMQELLETSKLDLKSIDRVEIVGGSTRTPAIKALIKKVFGLDPNTSLNQDEAVARGCTIQCAILSPTLKVKEFTVTDAVPYAIELRWPAEKLQAGHLEVFPKNHASPFTKLITFTRSEPFVLDAFYSPNQHIPHPDPWIGKFRIHDVKAAPGETTTKVRVKTRVGLNGLFSLQNAYREEIVLVEESASSVQIQPMDIDDGTDKPAAPEKSEELPEQKMDVEETKEKKMKKQSKQIELRIEATYPEYSQNTIQEFIEAEFEMQSQDKAEKEKSEARNALEEYIYEFRDKLTGDYSDFVTTGDREKFASALANAEDWLYGEGEDQAKNAYSTKLSELKNTGNPIANRHKEHHDRTAVLEDTMRYLQLSRKALDSYHAGDEKLSHIDAKDMEKVLKTVEDKQRWFNEKVDAQRKLPSNADPVVTVAQIRKEKEDMEKIINPILNKSKPAAPKAPPPESPKKQPDGPASNGEEAGEPAEEVPMDTQ